MFTEHEYRKPRPKKVLFSEHMYFVQICPVFAGPVTCVCVCVAAYYTAKVATS